MTSIGKRSGTQSNNRSPEDRAVIKQWVEAARAPVKPCPERATLRLIRQGWGALQLGRSIVKLPLCLRGRVFRYGLGTHADSEIAVKLAAPGRRLRAFAGVDDNPDMRVAPRDIQLVFSVVAGGRVLWRSAILKPGMAPAAVDVDLRGAKSFTLKIVAVNGNENFAHADWAEARVLLKDGAEVRLGDREAMARNFYAQPPFSFRYGGRNSADILHTWQLCRESVREGEKNATLHRIVHRDPRTGLECAMELREFDDFPALEWVLHFRNTGKRDTPLLENIQALDAAWLTQNETCLFRSRGSQCRADDFFFTREGLAENTSIRMAGGNGRSSNDWMPFFNLQTGRSGAVLAIGWTGQWAAEFTRSSDDVVRVRAGMEITHLVLHPGESIRSPLILLLFWRGEPLAGHNLLRRFIVAHHTPVCNGKQLVAPMCLATWGGMHSSRHLARIRTVQRRKLAYDFYWIDAGWFGAKAGCSPEESGEWYLNVGDWVISPAIHPRGLRPISDAAHKAGMKFLLWFEPERALKDSPLVRQHPDWFLRAKGNSDVNWTRLFNLGHPAACRWLTDFISKFITEQGLDGYRQDFNTDPLPFWRAADAPDRQGMTEIRHIEGLYAFWDELLRRHPHLLIDNCSSGGRRIDLETIGRSIPLTRSDFQCDPLGVQAHTGGLSFWVPLSATGAPLRPGDMYNFRSALSAGMVFQFCTYQTPGDPENYPWGWHRRMLQEHRRARPFFYGDYYPLTPFSTANDVWMAYQMHRSDLAAGLVVALRRDACPFTTADFRLRGLRADAVYELEDADSGRRWKANGRVLGEKGLRLTIPRPRESRMIFYTKRK